MRGDLKTFNLPSEELEKLKYAVIKTGEGDIKLSLFYKDAPEAVANFASLANGGFYDGLNFHRVIQGFMAQGGCPEGSGRGGPGYRIKCEVSNNPNRHLRGTLSMAHAGRDTGGSQFFICFAAQPHLDGQHTTFGQIAKEDAASFATLDKLNNGSTIESIRVVESL